ncbi:hypothetical protein G9A89_003975 [Geosiphon pyriformis]|nr:hypothetical protein G9A89_003975 [Geosiphon pyriformis]
MSLQQHLLALSNDFWNLFNTQKFSDVNIIVGEEPNIKTFHAHSQILAAKSPYFAVALSSKNRNAVFETQLGNDFNLLLRGSRDGFTPADFHRLCDNKGAPVSVIKVKGTGQLIGGYNPQSWYSRGSWLDGEGSFIFSLDGEPKNIKLSRYVGEHGPYGDLKYDFGGIGIVFGSNDLEVVVLY